MKALVGIIVAAAFVAGFAYAAEDAGKPAASSPVADSPAPAVQAGKPLETPPKPPATDLKFETPPVPDFMLKKPDKPLTLEEMKRQADEAAARARRSQSAVGTAPVSSGADAGPHKEETPGPGK